MVCGAVIVVICLGRSAGMRKIIHPFRRSHKGSCTGGLIELKPPCNILMLRIWGRSDAKALLKKLSHFNAHRI